MLTDSAARWLLVLHTGLGVTAVGAATHLFVWLRRYLRGQAGRRRAVIKFSALVLGLQVCTFLVGNAMYPTYKVEVRSAYLENAGAVGAAASAQEKELARIAGREGVRPDVAPASSAMVKRAAQAARWFDVKEHWVALGMFAAAALLLCLVFWEPKGDGAVISPVVLGLAGIVAGSVWLAAVIGVLTASWRAV